MNHRERFTALELAQALEENKARKARIVAYKAEWAANKYYSNYEEEKAKKAAYQREWRAKNRDKARKISKVANDKYKAENPATRRNSARKHNHKVRQFIIDFFGGKCVKCGFNDSRALQLDHIHGDGHKERKDSCGFSLSYRYKMVKEHPELAREKYQLLCANCNWIKRDENYEYSHAAKLNFAIQDM
jgi:hypothetical protein